MSDAKKHLLQQRKQDSEQVASTSAVTAKSARAEAAKKTATEGAAAPSEEETVVAASNSPSLPPPLREDALGLFAFTLSVGEEGEKEGEESGGSGSDGGESEKKKEDEEGKKVQPPPLLQRSKKKCVDADEALSSKPQQQSRSKRGPRSKASANAGDFLSEAPARKRKRTTASATTQKKKKSGKEPSATPTTTNGGKSSGELIAAGAGFKLFRAEASFMLRARLPWPQSSGSELPPPRVSVHGDKCLVVGCGSGRGGRGDLVVVLPSSVDAGGVTASMTRGGLVVTMPHLVAEAQGDGADRGET